MDDGRQIEPYGSDKSVASESRHPTATAPLARPLMFCRAAIPLLGLLIVALTGAGVLQLGDYVLALLVWRVCSPETVLDPVASALRTHSKSGGEAEIRERSSMPRVSRLNRTH